MQIYQERLYRGGLPLGFGIGFGGVGLDAPRKSRAAQCAGLPTEKQCRAILPPGQELLQGEKLVSPNGRYMAILQTDSNFVIYNGNQPLRAWGEVGTVKVAMQGDGNMVLYRSDGSSPWDSGTAGNGGARLVMQDDGNLVVYAPNGHDLWNSETDGPRVYEPSRSFIDVITAPTRSAAEAAIYAATGQHVTVTSVSVSPAQLAQAVQAVLSFVPVIGTGINAAIAAGAALASGENITDALASAAKNALPGGPIAAKGFDIAYGAVKAIANGQPLDEIALAAAREALPSDAAKKAFDIGTAIAHGQNVQQALVSGAASLAAGQLNKIALPPVLTEVAKSLPAETTRVASAIVNRPELIDVAVSEIAKRLGTNEATVTAAKTAVQTAKNSDAMAQIAKMTPEEQKQMMAWAALSRLTPAQREQLAAYIKLKTAPKKPLMQVHETTAPKPAARPLVVVHETSKPPAAAAKAGIYPPYPKHMSGTVSAPPPPHHAPPHHDGHPRPQRVFRGGHGGPGWWGWDAPSVVVVTEAPACRTWGDPIAMSASMQIAAKAALGASGGRPTVARGPDGVLYLFSSEAGEGLSARPCAA